MGGFIGADGQGAINVPQSLVMGRRQWLFNERNSCPCADAKEILDMIGIPAFIDEQFAMAESPWPPLATAQRSDAVDAFFANALSGQDQLRQRVVFALSSETLGEIVEDPTGAWTLAISCRDVFAGGGRAVAVLGPLMEEDARVVHEGFWD